MPQKAGEPPDPEKAAKLEARRKAYALKVWKADPKTQAQQQELDAARAQLQRLQDGTFCRQFQEMLAYVGLQRPCWPTVVDFLPKRARRETREPS